MKRCFGLSGMLIALALIGANAALHGANTKQAQPDTSLNILERFNVAKDGDVLLLPVLQDGKKRLFVLDTGCGFSVYDTSLKLGDAIGTFPCWTPGGNTEIKLYNPPPSRLGSVSVHQGQGAVGSCNCAKLRQVFGECIEGFLGMDFLSKHVVQIDFDEGEVRLLKKADASFGKEIKTKIDTSIHAYVTLEIPEIGAVDFMIDTGADGTGYFEHDLFHAAVDKGLFKVVGSTMCETVAGVDESRLAVGKSLSLDDFKLNGPIICETTGNLLGRGFWSRFVVTFDFPNERIYLKKGKGFDRRDARDLSGLHLLRVDGKTVVHTVDKNSAAAARGIKMGDQIMRLANTDVAKMTMFQLRLALSAPQQMVPLVIRRGDNDFNVELIMK